MPLINLLSVKPLLKGKLKKGLKEKYATVKYINNGKQLNIGKPLRIYDVYLHLLRCFLNFLNIEERSAKATLKPNSLLKQNKKTDLFLLVHYGLISLLAFFFFKGFSLYMYNQLILMESEDIFWVLWENFIWGEEEEEPEEESEVYTFRQFLRDDGWAFKRCSDGREFFLNIMLYFWKIEAWLSLFTDLYLNPWIEIYILAYRHDITIYTILVISVVFYTLWGLKYLYKVIRLGLRFIFAFPIFTELRVILNIKKDGNCLKVCEKEYKQHMLNFYQDLRASFIGDWWWINEYYKKEEEIWKKIINKKDRMKKENKEKLDLNMDSLKNKKDYKSNLSSFDLKKKVLKKKNILSWKKHIANVHLNDLDKAEKINAHYEQKMYILEENSQLLKIFFQLIENQVTTEKENYLSKNWEKILKKFYWKYKFEEKKKKKVSVFYKKNTLKKNFIEEILKKWW